MKKIVFINPKTRDMEFNFFQLSLNVFREKKISIPRYAPMIFAALTPPEYEFVFIDDDYEDVDLNMDVDLVAISAITVQINRAYEIADHFRSRGIPVVIGGIHASVQPDEVSRHCDATMIGQGEHTWPDMLKDFEQGTLKKFYDAKNYPPVDKLISPRFDAINHNHYLSFPIQATSGCPYECDFCSIRHTAGDRYKIKPVEQVISEIKKFEKYNKGKMFSVKKVYFFVDENLYVNREYIKELFSAMIELKISWTAQGTVNTAFDEEMLELMAKSGCRSYAIGFESISEKTLAEVNKPKVNKSQSYDVAIKNLLRHGIVPVGYLMFGFDNDDYDVFKRTVDFVIENHLIQPFFNVVTPYPGTKLYDRIKGENRIFDENWDHYNFMSCVYYPKQLSPDFIEEGVVWAAKQAGNFDVMRRKLDAFWSYGPWPNLKTLSVKERLFFILLGLKMKKQSKECSEFLFWVARNKKACDFATIFSGAFLVDAVMRASKGDSYEALVEVERAKAEAEK